MVVQQINENDLFQRKAFCEGMIDILANGGDDEEMMFIRMRDKAYFHFDDCVN